MKPREILKYSSNIGCAKIASGSARKDFTGGSPVRFRGENRGSTFRGGDGHSPDAGGWTTVDLAAIGFGQGVSVTAIQLTAAMAAIANDGVLMKPRIVRGIVDESGKVIREFEPEVVRRVMKSQTAWRITTYMRDVVEADDGTGRGARIADVSVAGKTGTSQKLDRETGSTPRRRWAPPSSVSFRRTAPACVIYVMLDEPEFRRWGGQAAAPLFRRGGEQILCGFDKPVGTVATAGTAEPAKGILEVSSGELLSMVQADSPSACPDFRGRTMADVLKIAAETGMEVRRSGSGWATARIRSRERRGRKDRRPGVVSPGEVKTMAKLETILEGIDLVSLRRGRETEVADVCYDSRACRPGSLFVAVPGLKADGHRFAAQAVDRGAAFVVSERGLSLPPRVTEIRVGNSRRALGRISANFYGTRRRTSA